ncbi:hypothetical protein CDAR_286371 [Caerostris darwini]|uniref:Uncharacterized protein n=1 Tax=Caerostris darwini TaxID=1538125 RepID=A0AAV4W153_9ARAC|nr:hypothetical protein CDAR_286371 [Caerostris darwini]
MSFHIQKNGRMRIMFSPGVDLIVCRFTLNPVAFDTSSNFCPFHTKHFLANKSKKGKVKSKICMRSACDSVVDGKNFLAASFVEASALIYTNASQVLFSGKKGIKTHFST